MTCHAGGSGWGTVTNLPECSHADRVFDGAENVIENMKVDYNSRSRQTDKYNCFHSPGPVSIPDGKWQIYERLQNYI